MLASFLLVWFANTSDIVSEPESKLAWEAGTISLESEFRCAGSSSTTRYGAGLHQYTMRSEGDQKFTLSSMYRVENLNDSDENSWPVLKESRLTFFLDDLDLEKMEVRMESVCFDHSATPSRVPCLVIFCKNDERRMSVYESTRRPDLSAPSVTNGTRSWYLVPFQDMRDAEAVHDSLKYMMYSDADKN